jgi:hypothetical protein
MAVSDRQIDSVLEELVPLKDVIREVQCSRNHLCTLLVSGKLAGRKVGGRWLVLRSEISGLKQSLTTRSAGKRHLAVRPSSER